MAYFPIAAYGTERKATFENYLNTSFESKLNYEQDSDTERTRKLQNRKTTFRFNI